jgi:hypothetical protein
MLEDRKFSSRWARPWQSEHNEGGVQMTSKLTRRTVTAGLGAAVAMPWIARRGFAASKPIVMGVPATSTAAIGAADHGRRRDQ